MNYAGVCTSVKIFVLCVCVCVHACVIERERERERDKGRERVHVCVKMRHFNTSTNMYSYIVHNSALLLHATYQTPTSCCNPGYKESDVKLLASTIIKHAIWELYLQAAATTSMRTVAYPTLTQLQRSGDEANERLVSDLTAEKWSHQAF